MEISRSLTDTELAFVNNFSIAAEAMANTTGVYDKFNIYSIASSAALNVTDLPREGVLKQAIWIEFLTVLKEHIPQADLKYPTIEAFLERYHDLCNGCSAADLRNLWEIANWMSVLFRFVPAKKNKGFFIAVVPKFVEGWFSKYVTGSGQTKATALRVKIFETEGEVKPYQRFKSGSLDHKYNVRNSSGSDGVSSSTDTAN